MPPDVTWWATNLEVGKSGRVAFDVYHETASAFERFETLLVGRHNVANCVAAIAVAHARGVPVKDIQRGVASFAGVRRRQELRGIAGGVTVLDDYAHHPTAVRETLKALRKRFPKRRLIAVYEPRSATSRRKTFQNEFAEAFAHADEVIVGRLFDPVEDPRRGSLRSRAARARSAPARHQGVATRPTSSTIVKQLAESAAPGDVVCVLSSGSFDGLHDKLARRDRRCDAAGAARRHAARSAALLASVAARRSRRATTSSRSFFTLRNENGVAGTVALEVHGDDAILRSLAVDRGVPRRGLRLDARRHGGQPGALARRAPDLSAHRDRERLLRGEVRVPRRRSVDAVEGGLDQPDVHAHQ